MMLSHRGKNMPNKTRYEKYSVTQGARSVGISAQKREGYRGRRILHNLLHNILHSDDGWGYTILVHKPRYVFFCDKILVNGG